MLISETRKTPSPPVERVERRLPDGRWVDARAYQEALAKLSDEDALTTAQADADGAGAAGDALTIRIYLADCVLGPRLVVLERVGGRIGRHQQSDAVAPDD